MVKKTEPNERDTTAFCTICHLEFSVSNKGHTALTIHENARQQTDKIKSVATNKFITTYFRQQNSHEQDLATAADLAHIFHAVKHNHSYNSLDCGFKLMKTTFRDSTNLSKVNCGRTKCTMLVSNVMSSYQLESDIEYLKANNINFSIQFQ